MPTGLHIDIVRPSTRAFLDEGRRTPGYSLFDWLHGYVYSRWPYLYIGVGTGRHPLAPVLRPFGGWLTSLLARLPRGSATSATFADTYHGKVLPLGAATRLLMVQHDVELRNLEQVVPYTRALDIVLRHPDHIVVLDCPCRASRDNPCLPLDVCLVVGEPFASFVAEHHPRRARWITPAEATEILRAEHERGHVHHAFFKDAMLGRFYAICNCCSCCCGAMLAWSHGTPMLAPSGHVSCIDAALCTGCGLCRDRCPFNAIALTDGAAVVDTAQCMGCGVCVSLCPSGAVSLTRDLSKGEPLEIERLIAEAGPGRVDHA